MTENKYFPNNFGNPLDRTSRPTFGSRPTVWETLFYSTSAKMSKISVEVIEWKSHNSLEMPDDEIW